MKPLSSFFLAVLCLVLMLPHSSFSLPALKVEALVPIPVNGEIPEGNVPEGCWMLPNGSTSGKGLWKKPRISLIDDTSQPAEFLAAYRKLNEQTVFWFSTSIPPEQPLPWFPISISTESPPSSVPCLPNFPTHPNTLIFFQSPQPLSIWQKLQ